jgi:hypothetical protein
MAQPHPALAMAVPSATAARLVEILALTLRAEAGSAPVRALEGLAALVVNRARLAAETTAARLRFAPGAPAEPATLPWPLLLARVCRAPFLFGCWDRRDPRHALLAAGLAEPIGGDAALAACRRIAQRAAGGGLADPTGGATHWHRASGLPAWAIGQLPSAEIGGLVFYRLA